MRKLSLICAFALLVFVSVGVAADDNGDLNSELNSDLNNNTTAGTQADPTAVGVDSDDSGDNTELAGQIVPTERGTRAISNRRGRQARRGQTVINLASDQSGLSGVAVNAGSDEDRDENSDSKSGKSSDEDEDEGGETPISN